MIDSTTQLVSFTIDNQLLAIPISYVERIVRAVAVTPLGKAPKTILGIIDYHGDIIPVLNLRKRLGFTDRPIGSSDRLMIIQTSKRKMAITVDAIQEVIRKNPGLVATSGVYPASVDAEGITRCNDGLILIYDPEKFLSVSEETALVNVLKRTTKKVKSNG
ncbi:MAG: purine-binding chemotaxis protein CheW [Bacteroidales bacterium]|nr:purine-binding chemotaxis protein CheW [Bacteroidales bacterium]